MECCKPKREINYQFKVLYAIGIFMVVAGHARADDFLFWNEVLHVAGFHMALFAFASGYFYSEKSEDKPGAYIWRKTQHLLIPFLLWNIFYGVVVFVLSKFGYTIGTPVTWQKFVYQSFTGNPPFAFNVPSWFVLPLFYTQVINVLVRCFFRKFQGLIKELIFLGASFLIGFAAIILAGPEENTGFSLHIYQMMYFMPFYTLGIFYKRYLEKKDKLSSFWYFTIIVLIELCYILLMGSSPVYSIIGMFHFDNPVLTYFMGIVGIAFWLRVSKILAPAIGKSKPLNLVADNTFSIMTNHELGFFVLNTVFYVLLTVANVSTKFDVEQYMADVAYIFLPRGRGFPLVYVVFGICFSILLQKIVDFVKSKLFKRGE